MEPRDPDALGRRRAPERHTPPAETDTGAIDRRTFLGAAAAAGVPLVLASSASGLAQALAGQASVGAPVLGPQAVPVSLTINGVVRRLTLEPRVTLLDALREYAELTGTKKGCDHGQCGACTVHVDGERVLACMTLAVQARGRQVTTIEGLSPADRPLHPMQQAFVDHDAFQCGYCTPGQVMSAVALLHEPCGPADDDVRECMSGNLCRCGAYPNIVAAVQTVRGHRQG